MTTTSNWLLATLAGVVLLGAGACTGSLPSERRPDAGDNARPPVDQFWDGATSADVVFNWYAFGDGVGPNADVDTTDAANSDCQLQGGFPASACSVINHPTPGRPFLPTDGSTTQMCTDGTAARVMPKDGAADYADLWGAGIGTDFSILGQDGVGKGYKDLSAYKGVAFVFSSDLGSLKSLRVTFPFLGQHGGDAPYWDGGGDAAMASSPLTGTTAAPQLVVIHWDEVGGPFYLTQEVPPVDVLMYPFKPSAVQAIQFEVFTNTSATTPYSFCVSNLTLLDD
jgi:hypothetical protein